ncbi:MAG TPA: replication-relaxation family protein, partial [Thermomicrobiales bacterium]|nr:replication-relaxation family protein [Thermomicrobiales bacterium]
LTGHARSVVRGRVLRRLTRWQVLAVSPRRIGGAARGSAGAAFALGSVGARLCRAQQQAVTGVRPRVRLPGIPTERTIRHTLAVSELYVSLVEQARRQGASVVSFQAEPASWWPNGLGGFVKPDAYTLLTRETVRDHWWIEVDLATESLPTVRRKLETYLDFVHRGQLGPNGVVPRVLVSTITNLHRNDILSVVRRLPAPASALFLVVTQDEAAGRILQSLRDESELSDTSTRSPLPV